MSDQFTFADLVWQHKGKTTRREEFLNEMDQVIPWKRLIGLIEPYYPTGETGRPPLGLEKMLRIHFLQHWFNLSDPAMEEALYDSRSMQRFAGITLGTDVVPDETTILKFRHLLERNNLPEQIFSSVRKLLETRGLLLKHGTIVDATILEAPSSTKNEARARDPEMRQTKKGNTWHFGMKVHVGTDRQGIVHTVRTTAASEADINQRPNLVRRDDIACWGDKAYWRMKDYEEYGKRGKFYNISRRATRGEKLSSSWEAHNKRCSRVRAHVEHGFLVWKRLWGFAKVRYRGLRKNTDRVLVAIALANIYMLRRKLAAV